MSKLKVIELKSSDKRDEWESFISSHKEANFLQSWNWGVFHENLGKKVFRFVLKNENDIVACALCVKEEAKRGTYFAIYGGPILNWEKKDYFNKLLTVIKKKSLEENCIFIRLRPQVLDLEKYHLLLSSNGLKPSPMHLTADLTLQIDLNLSEEQLLSQMRKNTRYEIRKAQKLNIQVKQSNNPKDIKEFYQHQLKLSKKHHFVPFSYKFLNEQFKAFSGDDQVVLFHSYRDTRLLASAFVIFYNNEAVYHYGISTEENKKLPGSYACQWAAILEAKKRGMRYYNLWGVAQKNDNHHRFAGVSVFKRGFGGNEVSYLPAHDLPLNWKYSITEKFEKVRKSIRRL